MIVRGKGFDKRSGPMSTRSEAAISTGAALATIRLNEHIDPGTK
jgi:hypothetical protein